MFNKLVQPECGGPNPLVAAAQSITRPTNIQSVAGQVRTPINFCQEFIKLKQPSCSTSQVAAPQVHHHQQHQQQQQQQQQHNQHQNHHHQSKELDVIRQHLQHVPTTSYLASARVAPAITAADQLEAKYREDLIAQTAAIDLNRYEQTSERPAERDNEPASEQLSQLAADAGKVDDVEFWQALAQQYMGPPAIGRVNYTFDERNPLKDKYANPFEEGLRRLEQGDIPSAALLFEAAVQKEPDHALAWRYLGTTQAQNEMDKLAIKALEHCLRLDPNDQQARLAIAVSLVNESRTRDARRYLCHWLVNNEKYQGKIQANLAEFEEAERALGSDSFVWTTRKAAEHDYLRDKFIEAARMSPDNPDAEVQSSLGVLFNISGEYDKAVDCFKAALSVRQDDSLLWNRLGATLANGNRSEEAVVAYRRALEISPGFLRSRYNLAISLIHFNLYGEAAEHLIQILNIQAAGDSLRSRSITSGSIWNTLRTVATLMNQPELYAIIDGRDLSKCNEMLAKCPGWRQS